MFDERERLVQGLIWFGKVISNPNRTSHKKTLHQTSCQLGHWFRSTAAQIPNLLLAL